MPYFKVDEEAGGLIANVLGETPEPPTPPHNTLAAIFGYIADAFLSFRNFFWELSDNIEDIVVIGDWLSSPFRSLGNICDGIYRDIDDWIVWANELDISIGDILSWEAINDRISFDLFDSKSPIDYISDALTAFYDAHLKPSFDAIALEFDGLSDRIAESFGALGIPDSWRDVGGIEAWLRSALYELLPWEDAPELSITDEAAAWLSSALDDIPWLGEIRGLVEGKAEDVGEFFTNPSDWLKKHLEGAFGGMLETAGKGLLTAVANYLMRLFESEDE